MAQYPEDVAPTTPYHVALAGFTFDGGEFPSGSFLTRKARFRHLFSAVIKYENYEWDELASLFEFAVELDFRATAFRFTDFHGADLSPVGVKWPKLYAGVTDGVEDTFDLPMKNSSGYSTAGYGLFRNGSNLTLATDYTVSAGAGTDGVDQVVLASPGAAGEILRWRATGRASFPGCHLTVDEMGFDSFVALITSTGLEIRQAA